MKKELKTPNIFILAMLNNYSMTVTDIVKSLSELKSDTIHSGAVWTTLTRLTKQGLVSFIEIGDKHTVKQYSITETGKEYLTDFLETLNKINGEPDAKNTAM